MKQKLGYCLDHAITVVGYGDAEVRAAGSCLFCSFETSGGRARL
jgi:hypothetical protein